MRELKLFQEGEAAAEQNTVEQLEKQMNQLFKMRVDVNDLDPQDAVLKTNKVNEGPTTFFVHSIEGIATPLKRVMNKCEFPTYCFQSTKDVPQVRKIFNTKPMMDAPRTRSKMWPDTTSAK